MDDSILEKKIRNALEKKAKEAHVDSLTSQRIQANVYGAIEEERNMKRKNWKKTAIAAAAICILGSITAMAVGRPAYISSHSSHDEEIRSYGEAIEKQKSFDAQAKSVESFSNGYTFKMAIPKHEEIHDEDHNTMESSVSMAYTYGKEGMNDVVLSASRIAGSMSRTDSQASDRVLKLGNGVELVFSTLVNKFVPPDYEITEEEKKLQEEGKLNVGYGSDQVEIRNSESVIWVQDGISYCLFMFGDDLSAEEMLRMAKEIAES